MPTAKPKSAKPSRGKKTKSTSKSKPTTTSQEEVEMAVESLNSEAEVIELTEEISPSEPLITESQSEMPAGPEDLNQLTIKLSQSLIRKLKKSSVDEGVSVDEFAGELLAEGLVLRAWEIMERKSTMRNINGNSSGNGNNQRQQNRSGNYNRGGSSNFNRGRQNQNNRRNYKNIMDDGASFREYVRSQEKRNK